MTTLKNWVENEYKPWKEAMNTYKGEKENVAQIVKKNAAELKYIVALLLEKREAEAVKIWNDLGLKPQLDSIQLNAAKDELVMTPTTGEAQKLSVSGLLNELQAMLAE